GLLLIEQILSRLQQLIKKTIYHEFLLLMRLGLGCATKYPEHPLKPLAKGLSGPLGNSLKTGRGWLKFLPRPPWLAKQPARGYKYPQGQDKDAVHQTSPGWIGRHH
ncbi:MAG: hypothetical protein KAX46_08090, partial [Chromatiaceae bacterium]|nr:hypothetical protein [Chromatiaceae bacterium]